ncbi:MAG: ABC transporter ATP-binding protein [Fibrobacter sp.]|nr:ABC transporter ATP-binding protein [Fibrobacter sp.]
MSHLLDINDLSVAFGHHKNGEPAAKPVQVTDRISFYIDDGEFFALVGESGCGKSVTAMAILRLLPTPSAKVVGGSVLLRREGDETIDLTKISLKEMQRVRGSEISCIFQEPMQALNPVLTIKKQLLEVFKFCERKCADPMSEIRNMLALAGFKDIDRVLDSYPHELSGGMLQRICIVMALLPKPKLIIADEPTTALDVTVQAQVLAVLKDLAKTTGTAVLLITHNMGIVSQYAKRMAVMYAGRVVEIGATDEVISSPMHPYTRGLLSAIPESHEDLGTLRSIPGQVPHARDFVQGCRFADRCELCDRPCLTAEVPPCVKVGTHEAYCFKI